MPKAAVHHALSRQWELLKALPTREPGLSAAQLTQRLRDAGFAATKRTVERDLAELERLFPLRCDDRAEPYGWHWLSGVGSGLAGMDFTEALSMTLVVDLLRTVAPVALQRGLEPKFRQAREKLGATLANRYADWTNRVRYVPPTLPFLPPKLEPLLLETVQEAIVLDRQLAVRYAAPAATKPAELTLHPLAFVQNGPVAYLVATALGYADPRLYALHRMRSAQMTGQRCERPKDFSLDAFLAAGGMSFGGGRSIRLRAHVTNALACYLAESPLSSDQRLTFRSEDCYVLAVTINDSWHLQFWILSQGAEITVVQPKELRARVQAALQTALASYRSA
jgi:predicted DNA-binding transcriptional regulator YafY